MVKIKVFHVMKYANDMIYFELKLCWVVKFRILIGFFNFDQILVHFKSVKLNLKKMRYNS